MCRNTGACRLELLCFLVRNYHKTFTFVTICCYIKLCGYIKKPQLQACRLFMENRCRLSSGRSFLLFRNLFFLLFLLCLRIDLGYSHLCLDRLALVLEENVGVDAHQDVYGAEHSRNDEGLLEPGGLGEA